MVKRLICYFWGHKWVSTGDGRLCQRCGKGEILVVNTEIPEWFINRLSDTLYRVLHRSS